MRHTHVVMPPRLRRYAPMTGACRAVRHFALSRNLAECTLRPMMLRARHLLFAWLTYGALQLALLGIPGASRQLTVGSRESRTQTTSQSITLGKRLLAADVSERRATTPFVPSAYARLDLPGIVRVGDIAVPRRQAPASAPAALPPARAPPALA